MGTQRQFSGIVHGDRAPPGLDRVSAKCHKTRDEGVIFVVADSAEMLPPVTFVLASPYCHRFKFGMRLFLSKFSLHLTQSAFVLSLSLPLSFSSSSYFLLSPSRKTFVAVFRKDPKPCKHQQTNKVKERKKKKRNREVSWCEILQTLMCDKSIRL